jgi:hypothetical protein
MKKPKFVGFAIDHLRIWWGLWAAVLGVPYLIYKVNSPVADLFRKWVVGHSRIEQGVVATDDWPPTVLAAFCFVTLSLLCLSVFSVVLAFQERRKRGQDTGRGATLLKTFIRTTQAADLIAKKLFPVSALPVKKVLSSKQTYCFYEDGDCYYCEELVLCAKDKDVHSVEKLLEADPAGDSVEFPDEIDLKLESSTSGKLVQYLINKNEP